MINLLYLMFMICGFVISMKVGLLILLLIFIFKIDFYIKDKKNKQDIEKITQQIDQILYHHQEQYIQNYQEGILSILENEIHKLVLRLSDQNTLLKKERMTLKESLEDVSHQIKTPLTSLNLIVERLQDSQITLQQKNTLLKEEIRLLDKIEWLIQTLLQLAQLDAHSIEFKKDNIHIQELITKVIEPFEIIIDLKDIHFEYYYQDIIIIGDNHWLQEALSNIVKNCIEQLDEGGTLKISVHQNPLYDELIIEDNGKGISVVDLPHLFDRFYKSQNSQGFGIGLALTKKIIESQNGTITVENNYPGAKFIIHIYKEVI